MAKSITLKAYLIEDKKYIHSVELYNHLGLAPPQYARWLKSRVIESGIKDVDYFSTRIYQSPIRRRECGRPRFKEYFFPVSFASALCLLANTKDSKVVRLWLASL